MISAATLKHLQPSKLDLKSYSGNRIEVLGCIQLNVSMGNIQLENVNFYIVGNQLKPILGTPALEKNGISICFSQKKLIQNGIKHAWLTSNESKQVKNYNLNLFAIEKRMGNQVLQLEATEIHKIPPNSEKIINCRSRYPVLVAGDYSVETESADHKLAIIIGKSVSTFAPNYNKCILRVCNATDAPVLLPAGVRLINAVQVTVPKPDHKQPLYTEARISKLMSEIKINAQTAEILSKTENLIKNFHDVFATDTDELSETSAAEYNIDTGNAPPQAAQRYRTPYYLRDEMDRIIKKNVKSGLMSPTSSPWAAPVLLVKKSNGSWRLVCDYRKLNAVTVTDSYPLPEINDLVTELAESKFFSVSDLFSGFHQIPCTQQAKEKLAITTELGQFTWNRMPMGAKNCPAVFQRLMDNVFRKIPKSKLIIYLDDLLVHSSTETENLQFLEQIFQVLRDNNLKLRADKTELLATKVRFCGFDIENGKKMPSPAKIEAIKHLKTPTTRTEAQSVFGLLNYHRVFIPKFASKAVAITKTYRGGFKWTEEAEKSLKHLKMEVGEAALQLKIPNIRNASFVLETDACNNGYGAVLFICNNNELHAHHNAKCLRPVEYASGMFSPAQMRYQTMEKELFCGKIALNRWSHYLLGRKFTWRTDNACLTWASRIRSKNMKIATWLATIGQFDFTIELRPSKAMKISDCLSRQFTELNALQVTKRNLSELQAADSVLHYIKNYVSSNRWPNNPDPVFIPFLRNRQHLFFGSDGELLININNIIRTIPAEIMKTDIIQAYHDKNGHPGEQQCVKQLSRNFFWPGLTRDVKTYIKSCHRCQITKPNLHPRRPPHGLSETPEDAWEFIAFDLIGPLSITENGNKYALVGIDVFSKKVYATALTSKHATIVGREIRRILMSFPKMPKTILTDNGTEFATVPILCDQLSIKHNQSAPYHPQTNGAVERANQTLKSRIYASDNETTWDDALDEILHSINCSENVVTGFSPFQVETGLQGENIFDVVEHEAKVRQNVGDIRQQTKAKILEEKRVRHLKHENLNFKPFTIGELVLMKNRASKHPRYRGPLKIIEVRADGLSYTLEDVQTELTFIRHCSQLKIYTERQNPEPLQSNDAEGPEQQEEVAEPFVIPMFVFPNLERRWQVASDSPGPSSAASSAAPSSDTLSPSPQDEPSTPDRPSLQDEPSPPDGSSSASPSSDTSFPSSPNERSPANESSLASSLSDTSPSSPPDSEPPVSSQAAVLLAQFHFSQVAISTPEDSEGEIQPVDQFEQSIYESIASDSSTTSSEAIGFTGITVNQLTIKELQDIAKQYDVARAGPKKELRERLVRYINATFPSWPTDENGVILFEPQFAPQVEVELSTKMTKNELISLMKSFKIPKPSKKLSNLGVIRKDTYVKHINEKFQLLYPDHPRNAQNILIFQPDENITPAPSVAEIAHLQSKFAQKMDAAQTNAYTQPRANKTTDL